MGRRGLCAPDDTAANADTTSCRSPSVATQSLYPVTGHGDTDTPCWHPLESEPTGDASDHGDDAPRAAGQLSGVIGGSAAAAPPPITESAAAVATVSLAASPCSALCACGLCCGLCGALLAAEVAEEGRQVWSPW
nr:unnamed protein product [Digitaria exilis]